MADRLELQELLTSLLPEGKVAYFQPPPSMGYPTIEYHLDRIDIRYADNLPYKHAKRYQLTVMDKDPDSDIPDKVAQLPRVAFDRKFTADNLHHFVFTLFF
jgi:hypothetical protein